MNKPLTPAGKARSDWSVLLIKGRCLWTVRTGRRTEHQNQDQDQDQDQNHLHRDAMQPGSAPLLLLLLLLGLSTASCFELLPEEAAPRRARFSSNSPADVARCLNGAVAVGCGFFSCLENSTCDTDGMHEICELFLHSAATFNTEGKTFVKKSLHCISQGISGKVFQTIRRCNIFQRMIAEVQEECYTSLDICTVARTNPDAIGEVVQVPTHFPNRYYSTLLQTLQACDEQTVAAVRAGLVARLGPDMETFLQLVQNKPCSSGSSGAAFSNPSSWRNVPVFNVQQGFRGRDPTHLFARRSVDDLEGGVEAEQ